MPTNQRTSFDHVDDRILAVLQRDGRVSVAELARSINLSASSTSERLRRLSDVGAITGYAATVSPQALGYQIAAFIRLAYPSGRYQPFDDLVASTPEITEAHHVTGDDCFIIKVIATSMPDLERIAGRIATLGRITTNVVYSSRVTARPISPATQSIHNGVSADRPRQR